jgi:hypothetical protein
MKMNCTIKKLLSVPVAAAAIGFGVTVIGQDRTEMPVKGTGDDAVSMVSPHIALPIEGDAVMQLSDADLPDRPVPRRQAQEPPMLPALGGLVFDQTPFDGSNGISSFEGNLGGTPFDRRTADDFEIDVPTSFTGVEIDGVWFSGVGAPGPVADFNVWFIPDSGGAPNKPAVCEYLGLGFIAANAGYDAFTRPAVRYSIKLPDSCTLSPGRYWVAVQPAGATDNFFHLTANAGAGNLNWEEMHIKGDFDPPLPDWTPGSQVFGEPYDLWLRLYAADGELSGACCVKVDGVDDCLEDVPFAECDGVFHANQSCADVTCPSQVECPDDDPCPPCVGDFDENGVVDGGDLLTLLSCWGPVTSGCECVDIDPNGVIDGGDLLTLLANWGPCPTGDNPSPQVVHENEPCGERTNDGCNMDPPAFGDLNCGDIVCGTAWTAVESGDAECPGEEGHLPGTCGPDGAHCGAQSPDGCWCDSECWGFGDCCIDICDECFGAVEIDTRDTDWYRIVVKEPKQRVTWRVHAEFPATAIIGYTPEDCDIDDIIIIASATGQPKLPFEVSACLQPDIEYFLFVAPSNFTGLPCDGEAQWGNEYTAEVICVDDECLDQKGACCVGLTCLDVSEVECAIEDGVYFGDGTDCDSVGCVGACCLQDAGCVETGADDCINNLEGAFRGNDTTCDDMVPVDVGCNGTEQLVPICRDCGAGGQVWCNLQDACDEDLDVDPYNGGCNYFDEGIAAFEQVCCGDLVGGTIWAIDGVGRDLDWRVLNIKEDSAVQLQIDHGFGDVGLDAVLLIARAGCPTTVIASATVQTGGGLFTLLDEGVYYVIVSSEFAPAGGPSLECGTASSNYQLQITCAEQQPALCDGNCFGLFIPHDAYPGGVCSCFADTCVSPFSSDDLNNPNHCCPNICDFCDTGICDVGDCLAAADITANINGAPAVQDNTQAAGEGALPAGSPSCQWQGQPQNVHNTLWFKFVAPANGAVTIETCGSDPNDGFVDSVIALYEGECGSLLEIGCGGDDCPAPDTPPYYSRIIATGLTPGNTYYLSVSNNGGWAGSTPGIVTVDITSP